MIQTVELKANGSILTVPELAVAIPCTVSNASVTATNEDGKKIIHAGTPLYGTEDVLMNRQAVLSSNSASGTAYGIALHDIVFDEGDNKGATLLIAGYVDYLKLDKSVQTLVDTAKANLAKITFIKGRAN